MCPFFIFFLVGGGGREGCAVTCQTSAIFYFCVCGGGGGRGAACPHTFSFGGTCAPETGIWGYKLRFEGTPFGSQ